MTSRELMLSTLRGEPTPRVAWAPFLTYWWDYNTNPRAEAKGEAGFKASVGCDVLMRGHCDRPVRSEYRDLYAFRTIYGKTRIEEKIEGKYKYVRYVTPVGELMATYTFSPEGNTWFLTGHPVREEGDFDILRYIIQDQAVEADDGYLKEIRRLPEALFVPLVSPLGKTGFQSMIEFWVGTEELAYAMCDYPEEIEETLKVMYALSDASARISAQSEAEVFISWEDTSTTNISPRWYEDYILPEINNWCDILHAKGKLYMQHACGHLKALAPLIAKSKIDALESVSAPPTGNTNILALNEILQERIALIGGLEPTFIMGATDDDLLEKVREELDALRNRRFILANADSCPPMVDINRFGLVTREVYRYFGMTAPDIEIYQ